MIRYPSATICRMQLKKISNSTHKSKPSDLNGESQILSRCLYFDYKVKQHNYDTCVLCYLHSQPRGQNNFLNRLLQNQEVHQSLGGEEIWWGTEIIICGAYLDLQIFYSCILLISNFLSFYTIFLIDKDIN